MDGSLTIEQVNGKCSPRASPSQPKSTKPLVNGEMKNSLSTKSLCDHSTSPRPHGTTERQQSMTTTDYLNSNKKLQEPEEMMLSPKLVDDGNIAEIKTYETVPGLKQKKSFLLQEVAGIDNRLQDMEELKQIVKKFSSKMKEFSSAILKLDRNRQGVPYVANVKSLFQSISQELNNETIKTHIGKMNARDVPFVMDMNVQFRNLHKICEQVIVHHVHYHVTYLENFHFVAGKLRGMMKAIVALYYTDETFTDDFLEQSFDDLVIEPEGEINSSDESENDSRVSSKALMSVSPRQTPPFIFEDFQYDPNRNSKDLQSLKNLKEIREQLREADKVLGSIHRLSLGNPKIQSLRDYFTMVGDILSKINLTALKVNDVPFVNKIEAGIIKMIRLSALKRPSERHVEQMKLLLGEVDGRALILTKNLISQGK